MSHLQTITLMTNIKVRMLLRTFGTETMCIQILLQEMLDLKYVIVLGKHKFSGKERNFWKKIWGKVYTSYLSLL